MQVMKSISPQEARMMIRRGEFKLPTSGVCEWHVQGNLAILPKELAFDFLLFATRNPKSCPILDVIELGSCEPKLIAKGCDSYRTISICTWSTFAVDADYAVL